MKYKLKDIAEIIAGGTPSTKIEQYWNGEIAWITPKDLANHSGRYISRGERNITKEGLENSSTKLMPINSVLFTSRAPIGYVAIAKNQVCTNQGFKSLVCKDSICYYMYIYYWLIYNTDYIKSKANGSTFQEISTNVMKEIEIELPSIDYQKKVANILEKIDEEIELNNQINDNLYEIQKCYFKKLFKSNSKYEIVRLDELCSISAGGDAPKEKSNIKSEKYNIPIISNSIDNDGIYGYTDKSKINAKSITISARGTIGFKVLRNYAYYPIVRLISLVPKTDMVSSEYIFYILDDISINSTGTTQQQLTVPMVKDLKIKIFNKELIEKFTMFSINLNNKIENNKIENQNLEQLRNTLLPKLMNGEIDLNKIKIE